MNIDDRIVHLEAACARGWQVFPCNGKHPATKTGFKASTDDVVRWRQQWLGAHKQGRDWNIGVYAGGGDPDGSHLVVIDCDVEKPPAEGPFDENGVAFKFARQSGISAWLELCAEHDFNIDDTYNVATPSGGLHTYFSYDGDEYIKSNAQQLLPLVDVRGDGGYVVGAGSEIDGIEYDHCGSDNVLPIPNWLLEMVRTPAPTMSQVAESVKARGKDRQLYEESTVKFLTFMAQDIETAAVGTRNQTLANKLWRTLMAGGDETDVEVLAEAARRAGLDEREITKTIQAAMRHM